MENLIVPATQTPVATAHLSAGSKGAQKVPFSVVQALPVPRSLGRFHRPVPHQELVYSLRSEIAQRGYVITREEFALTVDGARLYAVFILNHEGLIGNPSRYALSIGVRNATDQSLGIKGVAGANVFVCDNGVLRGSEFIFAHKNTTSLTGRKLDSLVTGGFDRFLQEAQAFETRLKQLSETTVKDDSAKVAIYNAFTKHEVAALRLLPVVHKAYFEESEKYPEVVRGTVLGLHNAFTRAFKELRPTPQFLATRKLGEVLGL